MNNEKFYAHKRIFFFAVFLVLIGVSGLFALHTFVFKAFNNQTAIYYLFYLIMFGLIFLSGYLGYKQSIKDNQRFNLYKSENENYLHKIKDFITSLNSDDFNSQIDFGKEKHELSQVLVEFREKMLDVKKAESERQNKEQKERWSSEGIVKFETLIRDNGNNKEDLAYSFISNLVKYIDANQAGFFLQKEADDNNVYELVACYAWGRKKFTDKEIKAGEGLTGACIYEKEAIYMTDIPEEYVEITSGMGHAKPRCVFIVPLIHNEQLLGAIEIASLKKLEPHKREFIETIMHSLAATISNLSITQHTSALLEQSKIQTEQLQAQEEELKQNLEEMQSTQEELQRKQEKMKIIAAEVMAEEQKLREFIDEFKEMNI